jgi:integrase/recombinase XerC
VCQSTALDKGISPVEAFISYIRFQKRYAENTVISYQNDLIQFFKYTFLTYGEETLIGDINHLFIRSWLAQLKQGGISSRAIGRKISTLKSFYRFLLIKELVSVNPMSRIISPKVEKRLPGFLKEEEMANLFEIADFTNPGDDNFNDVTDRLMLAILYATGIRRSELISLKTVHVDFYNRSIKVLGKGSKERIIPVSAQLSAQIRDYMNQKAMLGPDVDASFLLVNDKGRKLYPKYVYRKVKNALASVTTMEKVSPHLLRHTFATHMTNRGADLNAVKELLGHSSLAATQVYTHNTIGKLKEVHRAAHPKS